MCSIFCQHSRSTIFNRRIQVPVKDMKAAIITGLNIKISINQEQQTEVDVFSRFIENNHP